MNKDEIISKLEAGLKTLIEQDGWLLENDLSERSIAHRLAFHLQILFDGYTVDCEYNGAVGQEPFARKKVQMVKRELLGAELELRKREEDFLDDQLIERSAYPDIIIHQ